MVMTPPDHYLDPNNYTLEAAHTFDENFISRVVEICKPYSLTGKDKPENYTEKKVRWTFKTRFEHGFYIVKCKDEVVLTFGIDEYRGWGVVSRYLKQPYFVYLPVCLGFGFPEAVKHLGNKIEGLCCTQNIVQSGSRNHLGTGIVKFSKLENKARGGIYETAYYTALKTSRVEFPIKYREMVQVGYNFSGDLIPPFDRAEGIVLPDHYNTERYRKYGSTNSA